MSSHSAYSGSINPALNQDYSLEVDLRKEFQELLHGSKRSYAHASVYLLRRLRRDASDLIIPCQCFSSTSGEPDVKCSLCSGVGYYFDEEPIFAYKATLGRNSIGESFNIPGQMTAGNAAFYFEYNKAIRQRDFIVEAYFDISGRIESPLRIKHYWDIINVDSFRADSIGRLEYFRCIASLRPEGREN